MLLLKIIKLSAPLLPFQSTIFNWKPNKIHIIIWNLSLKERTLAVPPNNRGLWNGYLPEMLLLKAEVLCCTDPFHNTRVCRTHRGDHIFILYREELLIVLFVGDDLKATEMLRKYLSASERNKNCRYNFLIT